MKIKESGQEGKNLRQKTFKENEDEMNEERNTNHGFVY